MLNLENLKPCHQKDWDVWATTIHEQIGQLY